MQKVVQIDNYVVHKKSNKGRLLQVYTTQYGQKRFSGFAYYNREIIEVDVKASYGGYQFDKSEMQELLNGHIIKIDNYVTTSGKMIGTIYGKLDYIEVSDINKFGESKYFGFKRIDDDEANLFFKRLSSRKNKAIDFVNSLSD